MADHSAARKSREPLVPPGKMAVLAADMTAVIAADVPLSLAQQNLAQHNQWLAIDGPPDATIAQLVEMNSTGPLRLGYGAWRDVLLGAQFQNGRGELITAGGLTLKNVAGYDLTKFMIGQGQIFGKMVTVTTRTYAKPTAALLAKLPPEVKTVSEILTTPNRPQWAML